MCLHNSPIAKDTTSSLAPVRWGLPTSQLSRGQVWFSHPRAAQNQRGNFLVGTVIFVITWIVFLTTCWSGAVANSHRNLIEVPHPSLRWEKIVDRPNDVQARNEGTQITSQRRVSNRQNTSRGVSVGRKIMEYGSVFYVLKGNLFARTVTQSILRNFLILVRAFANLPINRSIDNQASGTWCLPHLTQEWGKLTVKARGLLRLDWATEPWS